MRIVEVNLGVRSYPIYIEAGALERIGERSRENALGRTLAIITDTTVGALYVERVASSLQHDGFRVHVFQVPPGEETKSLRTAENLYGRLIKARLDRKSTVFALGGGVVGDLAGFVAATFLRGVTFVQVPTTLLAQTDSSVGGKVGVNHRLGKNLIGSFYQPRFVVIDPSVLRSLPVRELWAGLGEVVKYGLIWDENLFRLLETNLERVIDASDLRLTETIIENCCRIKAEVVEKDEREGGLRRILNFGHTIGHALEAVTHYELFRHGEAVILGMRVMSWLSNEEGLLSKKDFNRIESLLGKMPIGVACPVMTPKKILGKVRHDKKVADSQLCVILLRRIGQAVIKEGIEEEKILQAISYLLDGKTVPTERADKGSVP